MNVLVIAPHMDDEVLGMGGTICKHVARGDTLRVLFLANRVYNHRFDQAALDLEEQHALAAKAVLGYQEVTFARLPDEQLSSRFVDMLTVIETAIDEFEPEMVYLNHRGDPHQDHKAAFEAGVICSRTISALPRRINRVACYEVPSSTDQSPPFGELAFLPNLFVDITPFVSRKVEAMACYETEGRSFPHPRSREGIETAAAARGTSVNLAAAEAFTILREEWC